MTFFFFDTLLSSSDIISLHCPLTKETHHLIDERAVDLMRDGVMLINTNRMVPQNTREIVEGFTSDMSLNGGGVENKRQGNEDPRGNIFCRNGQGCDYSHTSQYFYFNPGTDGAKPYEYCPPNTKFVGVNSSGQIICSK